MYNPADYKKLESAPIAIFGSAMFDMCRQLLGLSIPQENILFGVNFEPAYDLGNNA